MKTFSISYRDEFYAKILAKDKEGAIKKFEKGDCEIKRLGELHPEFIEVRDKNGHKV